MLAVDLGLGAATGPVRVPRAEAPQEAPEMLRVLLYDDDLAVSRRGNAGREGADARPAGVIGR